MRFEELYDTFGGRRFPMLGERAHPDKPAILAARADVARAMTSDPFLIECIANELRRIATPPLTRNGLVPFFTHPETGVTLAFGYWAPGSSAGPHEHTAWTITAVCRNALEVQTFDRDESYRRGEPVPKNLFAAPAGSTGYVCEPCIHDPRNPTAAWSLSFHVASPRDGEPAGDGREPLPAFTIGTVATPSEEDPYARVVALRRQRNMLRVLAGALAPMREPEAAEVLEACSALAPALVRGIVDEGSIGGRTLRTRAAYSLERAHGALALRSRVVGDTVSLDVESAGTTRTEIQVSAVAAEAFAFVAANRVFDLRAIPGDLTDEERLAIADALEESCLFRACA